MFFCVVLLLVQIKLVSEFQILIYMSALYYL